MNTSGTKRDAYRAGLRAVGRAPDSEKDVPEMAVKSFDAPATPPNPMPQIHPAFDCCNDPPVEGGFYREIEIHRVVDRLDSGERFVAQVGDPTATGNGGPGFDFDLEKSTLAHDFGVLSMARAGNPDTNGSQVFVALGRPGTARLDGRYAAFGELVSGPDALNAIATVPVDENDRPLDAVLLREARSVPAPPLDRWPEPSRDPQIERAGGR